MKVFVGFFTVWLLSVRQGHLVFHPHHNGQWPPTSKDFNTRSYPLHYFLILILEKEPVFPFWMFSAKQVQYWYHFYNVFGMTRSLTWDWTLKHFKSTTLHKGIHNIQKLMDMVTVRLSCLLLFPTIILRFEKCSNSSCLP